ncbi:MAG: hypothetical protein V9G08_01590 [Dermatophilaceae bacterium]
MRHSRLAGLAGVVMLAACSSASTPTSTVSTVAAPPSSSAATAVPRPAISELKVATTTLGDIVVDGAGMTLYMYTKDTKGTTASACTGGCLVAWPLVVAADAPKLTGVTGTVATIPTADGRKQVTLDGWPLYYYAKDAKAGDVTGQNVGQVWFVLDKAGTPIKK